MNVLYVYADTSSEWNCSQWRCLSPADALNASGRHKAKLLYLSSFANHGDPAVRDVVGPADVIVAQRNVIVREVWDAIDYWRGLGKPVVADLDDDYPHLPWCNPAHRFWIENVARMPDAPIANLTEGLRRCDALASPSRLILEDWAEVLPGVFLQNYPTGKWYADLPPRPADGRVVLGWGGSVSHYDSWWYSELRPALQAVCRRHPEVLVRICGSDDRLYHQLDLPSDQKSLLPGVPPEQWPRLLAQFDVGLAPLDLHDGAASYDRRRSWLKGIEYLLAGVPWIASDAEPYELLRGKGALVENRAEAWEEALEAILADLPGARELARERQAWARTQTLEENVERVVEEFSKVVLGSTPSLPDVLYVRWGQEARGAQTPPPPLVSPPAPEWSDRERLQRETFAAARDWAQGLGLAHAGVDLAGPMRYDLQQQLNRLALEGRP